MSERKTIDPLTLSVIEGRLNSLNEEVGERMLRQCFSFATAHLRDLGTSLVDKHERIISVGNWMPGHTAGVQGAIGRILDWIGRDNIGLDDFILTNDTFIVGYSHLADWSFVRPIFYEGELIFYYFAKTHMYDSGGAFPGGYFPRTYDCHGEGLMIPPIKIIEDGKVDEKVYSVILRNVRGSSMVRADNMLVYTSIKKAEERLLDLVRSYGRDIVLEACNELITKTEDTFRKMISTWPAGTYRAERAAEWDGTIDRPVWVRLALTVKPDEGQLILDFSDSDPQVDCINMTLNRLWSSVSVAVAWSLPAGIPRNQGFFNCLKVITKEGTCLSPTYPATTGAQSCALGEEVQECVQLALSQVVERDTSALWSRHLCPLLGGKRRDRIDPRTKSVQVYWAAPFDADGSSGAIYGYDGTDGIGPAVTAGASLRSPVEVQEWETPYRWLHYELLTDSAGDGRWRGGMGTRVEKVNVYDPKVWQPLDCVVMTGNSHGNKFPALGLMGGTAGKIHELGIIRKDKNVELRTMDVQYVQPGDIIWTKSGGGGGVGDPLDREVEKVREDALNECISIQKAKNVYGVVIDPETFEVKCGETTELRKKLKSGKGKDKIDASGK